MNIYLPFDGSEKSMELLKLASLYFDKVSVICGELGDEDEHYKFYDESATSSLALLSNSNILSIEKLDCLGHDHFDAFFDSFNAVIKDMGIDLESEHNEDKFLEWLKKIKITDGEHFKSISSSVLYDKAINKMSEEDEEDLLTDNGKLLSKYILYYMVQGLIFFDLVLNKKNCMSDNFVIDNIIKRSYNKNIITGDKIIAMNALPIFLPNIHNMQLEDILEIRQKSKDELSEMRYYIDNLSSEFSPNDLEEEKIKFYLEKKINPSIEQLKRKVSGLKMSTLQNFIRGFKDPKTYTPLLTTFFANIPAHIAIAASAGLITADAALEYKKQLDEAKNDPLYFSLKLRGHGQK